MAASHAIKAVTWDTGNYTDTITGVSSSSSDAITPSATAVSANIMCKSDMTTGTPASGDYTHFYFVMGQDPDNGAADEYATDPAHMIFLGTVSHNDEDPGFVAAVVPYPVSTFKIYAETAGLGAGDIVTISAALEELLMS